MTNQEWIDGTVLMYARIARRDIRFIRWNDTGQPSASHVRAAATLRKIHGDDLRIGKDVRRQQGLE